MQTYVVVMIVLVAAGTLFDIVHKGSARYFFENWRKTKNKSKEVGGGELVSIAVEDRAWSTCSRRASSATPSVASRTC